MALVESVCSSFTQRPNVLRNWRHKNVVLGVSGLPVNTLAPCSADHNTFTMDHEFNAKLSDDGATISVASDDERQPRHLKGG